jgi:bifunctional non-homologous end joining protein LigD
MAASRQHGLERIVAKRRASVYRPGQRSPDWRKVKHQRMQGVVIVGWRPGHGRRAGRIGSLILAVPDRDGHLRHVGGVGTGFSERMLDHLAKILSPLRQDGSPFPTPLPLAETRDAVWVRPELVGEVAYTEWTGDGRLRHPSWRGLRPDKRSATGPPGQVAVDATYARVLTCVSAWSECARFSAAVCGDVSHRNKVAPDTTPWVIKVPESADLLLT